MTLRQRFEIVWTEPATVDLKDVIDYIRRRNPQRVRELTTYWEGRIQTLANHPERARLVPETMAIGVDIYRELLLTPYRVVYRLRGTTVFIMGFIDGRRDLDDFLFERLSR